MPQPEPGAYHDVIVSKCAYYMRALQGDPTNYRSAEHLAVWNSARTVFGITMAPVWEELERQEAEGGPPPWKAEAGALSVTSSVVHHHPRREHPGFVPCCGKLVADLAGEQGVFTTTDPKAVTCRGNANGLC